MPIPEPTPSETESEFVGRCMADSKMLAEYPDPSQRYAVCRAQLDKSES